MYIELIRQVVEEGVRIYAEDNSLAIPEVLKGIRLHLNSMTDEYRTEEPDIDYGDPLCRLGYLYRHGAANATLLEHVLKADEVWPKKAGESPQTVRVCALGGGPGTELLGIAKYLTHLKHRIPRNISFTLLDYVPQWAETWDDLSQRIGVMLSSELEDTEVQPPIIAPAFLQFDVLDVASYKNYAFKFREADIVICNYLFSENKTRLGEAYDAVRRLAKITPATCAFVVIDRLEHKQDFKNDVLELFESVFGDNIVVSDYDRTLDSDEQTDDMGQVLLKALLHPRTKFHTGINKSPTVFWFVAKRIEG